MKFLENMAKIVSVLSIILIVVVLMRAGEISIYKAPDEGSDKYIEVDDLKNADECVSKYMDEIVFFYGKEICELHKSGGYYLED